LGLSLALGAGSCTGKLTSSGGAGPVSSEFASASGARRLTTAELDSTLRDLLGDTTSPATAMLVADSFAPFDNDITLQSASEALIVSLEILATDVADRAMADATRRDRVVPCTPSGSSDSECFRSFVETFVRKALRRPVTSEEVEAYMTLQAFSIERDDFYVGVGLVIRAVIQDPEFLYRIEVGTPTDRPGVLRLNAHEIATRMSYLLWGSTPDDALLEEAHSHVLETPEGRLAAATRMLDDDRAREQMHRFHAMWLGYRVIPHSAELAQSFNQETTALIDRTVFEEPQDYFNLFRSTDTYLNETLAEHYGLPRPDGVSGWVPYGDSGRMGILSHGSVLSSFAKFSDTSPTQRGKLIRTRLMCQNIPPPPPIVNTDEPPGNPDELCKFDRYAEHRSNSSCAGCHDMMDPIGFGLENYDMAGRFRTHDDGKPECIIEGVGEIPSLGTFHGPKELAEVLVDAGYIEACVVQQFYSFAVGRNAEEEVDALSELTDMFREEGHDLRSLILAYVASDRFIHRREEAL
jgi:hypothetical protein